MIVVTGGCGFIGSNLVRGLNDRTIEDVLVVDDLTQGEKFSNILDCQITDYLDYQSFLDKVLEQRITGIDSIFHLGACSDTMETDGRYMMRVNYDYSQALLEYSIANDVPFIYASSASVYGDGVEFKELPENENALNVYAYSKLLFDRHVRKRLDGIRSQVVGLRYFNVYGPREQHKGRMASTAYHFYNQMAEQGRVRLFEGSGGYGDGDQRRDFVWVGDAVDVNLFCLDHPEVKGIFNVGTGNGRSFNDMAQAIISSVNETTHSVSQMVDSGEITYIPFPARLEGRYQSYTQADVDSLRAVGYSKAFTSLEKGIQQYVDWRRTK